MPPNYAHRQPGQDLTISCSQNYFICKVNEMLDSCPAPSRSVFRALAFCRSCSCRIRQWQFSLSSTVKRSHRRGRVLRTQVRPPLPRVRGRGETLRCEIAYSLRYMFAQLPRAQLPRTQLPRTQLPRAQLPRAQIHSLRYTRSNICSFKYTCIQIPRSLKYHVRSNTTRTQIHSLNLPLAQLSSNQT